MLNRSLPVCALSVLALSLAPSAAHAAVAAVPFKDASRGVDVSIPCTVTPEGLRKCEATDATRVPTFDGVPLDTNVYLPAAPATGTDGNYPLVIQIHGYGQKKGGFEVVGTNRDALLYLGPAAREWTEKGYAVLQTTARGFGRSCGAPDSRFGAGCLKGWVHLGDTRFEVRDQQELAGMLVDSGLVDATRIGATGNSYGGGTSMALTTLRDRVMNQDGSYKSWKSPNGTAISLAAAAPVIPWSDLVYSLVPNGRTIDTITTSQTDDLKVSGIAKQSFISGLFATGQAAPGFYSPPGTDPEADLTSWFAAINAGEPYDGNPEIEEIKRQISTYHSSYYLDPSRQPAPTFIANGWTDDLFPADEALRWQRRFKALYPELPVSLMFFDFGHQRGSNRVPDVTRLRTHIGEWFDRYVKGGGTETVPGVEALLLSCPNTDKAKPSPGPFAAATFDALSPGELRFVPPAAEKTKTLLSTAGDPQVSQAVDPVAGPGACATTAPGDQTGTATWRLPAISGAAKTLIGSPVMGFDLKVTGTFPSLIGRLWDVDLKGGKQTLVSRGIYRPDAEPKSPVFELHGNGWRFEAGHQPKLELLGQDPPYARKSNGQFQIEVSNLDFRVPVLEEAAPGAASPNTGAVVQTPAKPLVPGASRPVPKPSKAVRRSPLRVTASTSPRRDRFAPFRFVTTGRVLRPAAARGKGSCSGKVSVRLRGGNRTRSSRRVNVRSNCTYRSVAVIRSSRSFRGGRLKVLVRFAGNKAMKARSAPSKYVRAG